MARNRSALVTIDATEFARFAVVARQFEPKLLTTLRKRIKEVGAVLVDAVKEDVLGPVPSGGTSEGDARQKIADGTSMVVSFRGKSAGIRVMSSSKLLEPQHKGLLDAYNQKFWDHPVYGNDGTKVRQEGNPYFGAAIIPQADDEMIGAMRLALDEACKAIGAVGR